MSLPALFNGPFAYPAYMAVWARDSGVTGTGGFSHVGSMTDLF